MLQCVTSCGNVLQCIAVCCSVLQCVAVCCSVLQCVAVCCSGSEIMLTLAVRYYSVIQKYVQTIEERARARKDARHRECDQVFVRASL